VQNKEGHQRTRGRPLECALTNEQIEDIVARALRAARCVSA